MTIQTLTLGRQKFVLVSAKDFQRLQQRAEIISAQDRGDVTEARRRKAKGPIRPYAELRKKLGLV